MRLNFLDNLRSSIIFLVVVFHAALAYMIYAPDWWYVLDDKRVLSADLFVIWADIFIMPVLFFISGYFGIKSFSKKSASAFWQSKFCRIALPWILGSMIAAPQLTYITFQSRSFEITFWQFYTEWFWGPAYQQGQYWYLGILLCFYALMAISVKLVPAIAERTIYPKNPSILLFLSIALLTAFLSGLWSANLTYGDGTWLHPLYLIVFQPTRLPFYVAYFALGMIAYRNHWFEQGGYSPSLSWGIAFAIFSVLYPAHKFITPLTFPQNTLQYLIINSLLHSFLVLTAILGLIAIYKQWLDRRTAFLAAMSALSYPVYLIHDNIVMEFNWLMRPLDATAFTKYLLVCLCSLFVCCTIAKFVMLRIGIFKGR
jgi:hypothetical protein